MSQGLLFVRCAGGRSAMEWLGLDGAELPLCDDEECSACAALRDNEAARRSEETDHGEREDCPTPRTLTGAIFDDAQDEVLPASPTEPTSVLEVSAGYGCWSSQLRICWGDRPQDLLHITGIEIFEARREHLEKWCDDVIIGPWESALDRDYDLVIGNPHFTALKADDPEQSMPAVLLRRAPQVLLLHPLNVFVRGPDGRATRRAYPPAVTWLVPGTVSFDGTSNVASDCYAASLWRRGHKGPTITKMLTADPLDVNARIGMRKGKNGDGDPYACWRWRGLPPGSEEPGDGLIAAPGWRPRARR